MNPLTRARHAIVEALEGIKDLNLNATPFIPSGAAGLPAAFLELTDTSTLTTRKGLRKCSFDLIVLLNASNLLEARVRLDSLISGGSIKNALLADRTLGGAVEAITIEGTSSLGIEQLGGYDALGHSWHIETLIKEGGSL